jgi:pyruvate dehydrogenase E1 component
MSEADTLTGSEESPVDPVAEVVHDVDPTETQEWLDSLEYVLASKGEQRVQFLLDRLEETARRQGVDQFDPAL